MCSKAFILAFVTVGLAHAQEVGWRPFLSFTSVYQKAILTAVASMVRKVRFCAWTFRVTSDPACVPA